MSPRTSLVAMLLLSGCASKPPDSSAPGTTPETAPGTAPAPVASQPAAAWAAPACLAIIERYRQALKAGSDRCVSDADCARFGGVDPDDVCGGVTSAETGRALSAISAELDQQRCPRLPYSCPAMEPRCVAGACR